MFFRDASPASREGGRQQYPASSSPAGQIPCDHRSHRWFNLVQGQTQRNPDSGDRQPHEKKGGNLAAQHRKTNPRHEEGQTTINTCLGLRSAAVLLRASWPLFPVPPISMLFFMAECAAWRASRAACRCALLLPGACTTFVLSAASSCAGRRAIGWIDGFSLSVFGDRRAGRNGPFHQKRSNRKLVSV